MNIGLVSSFQVGNSGADTSSKGETVPVEHPPQIWSFGRMWLLFSFKLSLAGKELSQSRLFGRHAPTPHGGGGVTASPVVGPVLLPFTFSRDNHRPHFIHLYGAHYTAVCCYNAPINFPFDILRAIYKSRRLSFVPSWMPGQNTSVLCLCFRLSDNRINKCSFPPARFAVPASRTNWQRRIPISGGKGNVASIMAWDAQQREKKKANESPVLLPCALVGPHEADCFYGNVSKWSFYVLTELNTSRSTNFHPGSRKAEITEKGSKAAREGLVCTSNQEPGTWTQRPSGWTVLTRLAEGICLDCCRSRCCWYVPLPRSALPVWRWLSCPEWDFPWKR